MEGRKFAQQLGHHAATSQHTPLFKQINSATDKYPKKAGQGLMDSGLGSTYNQYKMQSNQMQALDQQTLQ